MWGSMDSFVSYMTQISLAMVSFYKAYSAAPSCLNIC